MQTNKLITSKVIKIFSMLAVIPRRMYSCTRTQKVRMVIITIFIHIYSSIHSCNKNNLNSFIPLPFIHDVYAKIFCFSHHLNIFRRVCNISFWREICISIRCYVYRKNIEKASIHVKNYD